MCEIKPDARTFKPVVKWSWTKSSVLPDFDQVMTTPIVAQANDDNGDGVIDDEDIPDVIFMSYSRYAFEGLHASGVIRIVSGKDGSDI